MAGFVALAPIWGRAVDDQVAAIADEIVLGAGPELVHVGRIPVLRRVPQ
jgi:hypothetical protein